MKILFLTFGPSVVASSRVRVFQYFRFFTRDGIRYTAINYSDGISYKLRQMPVTNSLPIKVFRRLLLEGVTLCSVLFKGFQIARFVTISSRYDVIFIQKVLLPTYLLKVIKVCLKKKIVFDFDDSIHVDKRLYKGQRLFRQLRLYDLAVVANDTNSHLITEHIGREPLIIIGPIDTDRYFPKAKRDTEINQRISVGWIGSPSTQKYLEMLRPVFEKLLAIHEQLSIILVGANRFSYAHDRVMLKKWSLSTEVGDLQSMDIGIMPLPDDEWTRGKGGYKILQYMATGIPCVVSPVGVNKQLVLEGLNGFTAQSEGEWYERLSLLVEDSLTRRRLGEAAREIATERYSFQVSYPKLRVALQELVSH